MNIKLLGEQALTTIKSTWQTIRKLRPSVKSVIKINNDDTKSTFSGPSKKSDVKKNPAEVWMKRNESLEKLISILKEDNSNMQISMNSYIERFSSMEKYISEHKVLYKLLKKENRLLSKRLSKKDEK